MRRLMLALLCLRIAFSSVDLYRAHEARVARQIILASHVLPGEARQHVAFSGRVDETRIRSWRYFRQTNRSGDSAVEERLLIPIVSLDVSTSAGSTVALVDRPASRGPPSSPDTVREFSGMLGPIPEYMEDISHKMSFPPGTRYALLDMESGPPSVPMAQVTLVTSLLMLALVFLGPLLNRTRRGTAPKGEDWRPLRQIAPLSIFSFVSIVLVVILYSISWPDIWFHRKIDDTGIVLLLVIETLAYLGMFASDGRVELSPAGMILRRGLTGTIQRVRWSDIRSIQVDPVPLMKGALCKVWFGTLSEDVSVHAGSVGGATPALVIELVPYLSHLFEREKADTAPPSPAPEAPAAASDLRHDPAPPPPPDPVMLEAWKRFLEPDASVLRRSTLAGLWLLMLLAMGLTLDLVRGQTPRVVEASRYVPPAGERWEYCEVNGRASTQGALALSIDVRRSPDSVQRGAVRREHHLLVPFTNEPAPDDPSGAALFLDVPYDPEQPDQVRLPIPPDARSVRGMVGPFRDELGTLVESRVPGARWVREILVDRDPPSPRAGLLFILLIGVWIRWLTPRHAILWKGGDPGSGPAHRPDSWTPSWIHGFRIPPEATQWGMTILGFVLNLGLMWLVFLKNPQTKPEWIVIIGGIVIGIFCILTPFDGLGLAVAPQGIAIRRKLTDRLICVAMRSISWISYMPGRGPIATIKVQLGTADGVVSIGGMHLTLTRSYLPGLLRDAARHLVPGVSTTIATGGTFRIEGTDLEISSRGVKPEGRDRPVLPFEGIRALRATMETLELTGKDPVPVILHFGSVRNGFLLPILVLEELARRRISVPTDLGGAPFLDVPRG